MPNGIPQAAQAAGARAQVDQVRMVCNAWGGGWWRPNDYGAYGFCGPRPSMDRVGADAIVIGGASR